jgi:Fe-S-cluster containining protein
MNEAVWYQNGLKFSCTQCGNCCRGAGYVWVDEDEIAALAKALNLDTFSFEKLYTRKVGRGRSLREKANDDCIFYDSDRGCTVYQSRPRQCRTWPFWQGNLQTPQDWKVTQQHCPGCGQGELFSVEEITSRLASTKL